MGTNFYIVRGAEQGEHIGKRSAAGLYCWDCRLTLRRGGEAFVHMGGSYFMTHPPEEWKAEGLKEWYEACPNCGQTKAAEVLEESSPGRELGFNKTIPAKKHGVRSCASFTWAMPPGQLEQASEIVDEYEHHYAPQEFVELLEECPIQFFDSIGIEFS